MFAYEPLLSLVGAALLLAIAWLWSVLLFNNISAHDSQFGRAMKRLIMNQPLSFTQMQNPDYIRLKRKQLQLADQLHHSKLLVITNTLLVLIWASFILSNVSLSQTLWRHQTVLSTNTGNSAFFKRTGASSSRNNNLGYYEDDDSHSLVCVNILSASVVFAVLFVYRLNWLSGYLVATKARKNQYDQIGSTVSAFEVNGVVRPRRQPRRNPFRMFRGHGRSSKTIKHLQQQQAVGGDQQQCQQHQHQQQQQPGKPAPNNQERVKLQHFSMTYGTYSAASADITSWSSTTSAQASGQPQVSAVHGETDNAADPKSSGCGDNSKGKETTMTKAAGKSRSIFKLHKSTGSKSFAKQRDTTKATDTKTSNKLQRRQSNGSVASSQANLMRRFSDFDLTDNDYDDYDDEVDELSVVSSRHNQHNQFDTISCAMSVASNSTSQLQGNDLYPIDCSIQLDSQPTGTTPPEKVANLDEQQNKHKLAQVEL